MKLTSIIADPSLVKSSSKSKYSYKIQFQKKETVCGSHVDSVINVLRLLAESEIINLEELENTERLAGFHLLLDVTDLGSEDQIKKMITDQIPKYKNRYAISSSLTVKDTKYIVCREWTCERVDKFMNRMMNLTNSKIKNKTDHLSVERIIE